MPKKSTATIDPASADVVLAYVDDERGRSARNAPRRHLTHNDIARLAFEEALLEVARDVGQPVDRKDPDGPLIARPDPRDPDPALDEDLSVRRNRDARALGLERVLER